MPTRRLSATLLQLSLIVQLLMQLANNFCVDAWAAEAAGMFVPPSLFG
ncbi:hypothetical protein [Roseateles paludis]|jgi:hypothetical protein|uniref:MFS transporter n=1 Tax=Roseateles paludis TaxID=3145238 RepID=A0ABV0FVW2_9BURK